VSETSVPHARYATTSDGVRIAYTIHGTGEPFVYFRGLNSHAEENWSTGWTARYLGVLAHAFRVVLVDARGNGMSDDAKNVQLDTLLLDLEAVMTNADLRDVNLFGQGFGSPVAIAFAARHPEQIKRLLLYCAYAYGPEVVITDQFIETMRNAPQFAAAFMARETYPDDDNLPKRIFTMASIHTTPEAAVVHFEFARSVDVRAELASVNVPTLVMQPQRNPQISRALGLEVARGITDAKLVEIPGGPYNPFAPKSFEPSLKAIGDFVGVELTALARPVVLMLTDMVESTAMTQRAGEAVSRELHELHDTIVGAERDSHNGVLVQHTGDGMMATFQSAADAVECAMAIQTRIALHNRGQAEPLHVRVGLAHGEVYAHSGQPFTGSAQLVTRVANQGGAGDILITDPVHELVTGLNLDFGPERSADLKGFPNPVRLHQVAWRND
jgi:pimeloyl-ACP methyl ester carboxylesterase/class 3 adenylate cyclase